MHDTLRKMLQSPVFLDSSSLADLRKLITDGVRKSDTVVLLATKGVLTRPWCLLELYTAIRLGVPVVLIELEGHNSADTAHLAAHLAVELELRNAGAAEVLRANGIAVDAACDSIGAHLSSFARVRFNALASAATGLIGGVVATLISAAVGATFSAAIVVRESANSACVLGSVVAGYILCILVTFVPDEPEHRRIHAFFALCTTPAAIGFTCWYSTVGLNARTDE